MWTESSNVALKINRINFLLHRILLVLLVCTRQRLVKSGLNPIKEMMDEIPFIFWQLPSSIHQLVSSEETPTVANSQLINCQCVVTYLENVSALIFTEMSSRIPGMFVKANRNMIQIPTVWILVNRFGSKLRHELPVFRQHNIPAERAEAIEVTWAHEQSNVKARTHQFMPLNRTECSQFSVDNERNRNWSHSLDFGYVPDCFTLHLHLDWDTR